MKNEEYRFKDFLEFLKLSQKVSQTIVRNKAGDTSATSKALAKVAMVQSVDANGGRGGVESHLPLASNGKPWNVVVGAKAPPKTQSNSTWGRNGAPSSTPMCPICNTPHGITACSKFLKMSLGDRDECCKQKRLCFKCLIPNHTAQVCRSNRNCEVCGGRHHNLLHYYGPSARSSISHAPASQDLRSGSA